MKTLKKGKLNYKKMGFVLILIKKIEGEEEK